jgi:SAM-dependent methyltransferase
MEILVLTVALVLAVCIFGLIVFMLFQVVIYAWTMFNGAPFVPSSDERVKTMLLLANPKTTDRIVDLGSGDGKLVFAFAQKGVKEAVGVEINPFLVKKSEKQAKKTGLTEQTKFVRKNMFHYNVSRFDIVLVYGITYLMKPLKKKLLKELKPGTKIVSSYYKFPEWKAQKTIKDVRLYIR